ncbi:MAG: WecB/TagA/CpsF family glycosyltransferase [Desulfobacteraceae bacterium]|jgi:N-acetylglucosaminyldiphosphoundecaprenol N-acetyl-beta-D-mannosaminyltransferase
MEKEIGHYYFKGIKISDIDLVDLQLFIKKTVYSSIQNYFCLTDVGNLMMAQKDAQLASAINHSAASIADGTPLAWFGKLAGRRKVQRISGVDLFQHFLHYTDYKHFLLGDTVEIQQKVIQTAKKKKQNLKIGAYSPPFRKKFSKTDNEEIFFRIQQANPDIIWVSFGGGKQEKWMFQNITRLKKGTMIGVGAAFKYYTGDLTIPSKWIQRMGLQWMTRLIENPTAWMTEGPFVYRINFLLYFPFELMRVKFWNRPYVQFKKS